VTAPFVTSSEIKPVKAEKHYGEVHNGRYWLPDPADRASWVPGAFDAAPMPRGFMRTSNLIGAYSETRALNLWEQRKILRGLAERHDIYAELVTLDRDEEGDPIGWQRIIDQALRQAKADEASVIGTAMHKVLEHWLKTGQWIGTPEMIDGIKALLALLKTHLLIPAAQFAERVIVHSELRIAGRFDVPVYNLDPAVITPRKVRDGTPPLLMADLKTKRRKFWSVLEQRAQLAVYATADAMWDEALQCYVKPPPFDQEEGIILHVPQGGGEVQLLTMDLVKGLATARRAREVVDDRAGSKSAPMLREIVRQPPAQDFAYWKERLSLVETLEEGSEVIQAACAMDSGCTSEEKGLLLELAKPLAKDLAGNQLTS
jgi:hypothetical protein